MNDRTRQFLLDALVEAENLALDLEGMDFEFFEQTRQVRRSTERSLEIIGEALLRALASSSELADPELGLRPWVALRNVISHQYDELRIETLWQSGTNDLVELTDLIRSLLESDR